jgi:diacylglycerol O-acyltransferase / wax synthase
MPAAGRTTARLSRLTAYDQHCLRVETPARPIHLGILAVLEGGALVDPAGRLRLSDLRREIDRRVAGVPELRRVVYHPGPLAGGPLWVDDRAFRIDQHIMEVAVSGPGDDAGLLALAERLLARPLDRTRPLWRMWFVTGLEGGRIAVLVAVHHALADGVTAMRLVRSLLEPPLPLTATTPPDAPIANAPPAWSELVRDNVRSTVAAARRLARLETWRQLLDVIRYMRQASALSRHAPASSLNAPVGPRRRLATVRLDLATARRGARTHACGVNDVVLSLVAGGVRALLRARGEPVARLRPRVGVAVALFSPGRGRKAGNDIGTLHVALPLAEPDPGARLRLIAAERARARLSPMVAGEPLVRAWFGRFGVVRRSMEQQRLVNLSETYLPGPPAPIRILGTCLVDLLPIAPLAGNLGLSFVALSYAGRLVVTVRADADRFPDLDVLTSGMERDWDALAGSVPAPPPAHAGRARGHPAASVS